jgi:phosphoribosylformylglycinamidine synthase PurS subunit
VKATVRVTLKEDVLDPQGRAIQHAARSLGYDAVVDVRQGKYFEVELAGSDLESARALLRELCEKLLANPVIETYVIEQIEA